LRHSRKAAWAVSTHCSYSARSAPRTSANWDPSTGELETRPPPFPANLLLPVETPEGFSVMFHCFNKSAMREGAARVLMKRGLNLGAQRYGAVNGLRKAGRPARIPVLGQSSRFLAYNTGNQHNTTGPINGA